MSNVLELKNVTRSFSQGGRVLQVLKGVNIAIRPGEVVGLVGPSGAGKSTLLQIAGLLEPPTGGTVIISGTPVDDQADDTRTRLRREKIGFVYQFHHLLPDFTAIENLMLPQIIAGIAKADAKKRAGALLTIVGLESRIAHHPSELSGGEQQRVAIARALVNSPVLLLADEPTGNLDPDTAGGVFEMLVNTARATNLSALIATHNMELAGRMDRVLELKNGMIREV